MSLPFSLWRDEVASNACSSASILASLARASSSSSWALAAALEEPEALDLVPMLKCWADCSETCWLWSWSCIVVVFINVVVELGPEARGDSPMRSAELKPEGRAVSVGPNDFSLADRTESALSTALVREVMSLALGFAMAFDKASEALRVCVSPIASVTVRGIQAGSGAPAQVNLI